MFMRTRHARRLSTTLLLFCAATALQSASGQTQDSAAAPTPVVVGGYVDSYFSFNLDRPKSHMNQLRNFDVTENAFTVANAEISVTKAAAPLGFRVDADFGPTNDIVQSGTPGSLANIGQAYVTYVVPVGAGLTVDAGRFVTHMGQEVIKAKDDINYSRSLLFALSIPYYHHGIRASYPFSSKFTLCVHVYNGYNGGIPVNPGKTFGFQAIYTPTSALTVTGNYIGGPALPDSVSKEWRNVGNLIVSYQATDRLGLTVDAVYGQENSTPQTPFQGVALWKGVAGYVRYQITDPSAIAVRGEIYNDPKGFTSGAPQNLSEVTLTYEYKPVTNLILRAEYRYDMTNGDLAIYDGDGGPATRKNQATLGIGAIVVF
jgi:hypothetical protein